MKYPLLFMFMAFHWAFAQTVTFREIKIKPKPELSKVSTIIYPLVVTSNRSVDKLINDRIKSEMLPNDNESISIRQALNEQMSEGLINLYYEVTYKKNGILSLNFFAEGCGAHCSSWYTYFNFDLKTGKSLSINDLVADNKIDSFTNVVFADKINALNKYKKEAPNDYGKDVDSATINRAIEQVDENCMEKAGLENFSLSDLNIEIMDPCEFPHAIRAMEPDYKLKYSYRFMRSFLKPKFQNLFLK